MVFIGFSRVSWEFSIFVSRVLFLYKRFIGLKRLS